MRVNTAKGDAIFRGMVGRLCAVWNVRRTVFADDAGFSLPHLRHILENPGSLRLSDLRGIVEAYDDVTDEEIIGIVRGTT